MPQSLTGKPEYGLNEEVIVHPELEEGKVFLIHETVTTVHSNKGAVEWNRYYRYTVKLHIHGEPLRQYDETNIKRPSEHKERTPEFQAYLDDLYYNNPPLEVEESD